MYWYLCQCDCSLSLSCIGVVGNVQLKSIGQLLFDAVVHKLQLVESDYFDLEYTDQESIPVREFTFFLLCDLKKIYSLTLLSIHCGYVRWLVDGYVSHLGSRLSRLLFVTVNGAHFVCANYPGSLSLVAVIHMYTELLMVI